MHSAQYAPDDEVPLAGYATSMLTFAGLMAGALMLISRNRRPLPHVLDVALLGIATHKLSRIVSKDFVTAPLRAPFTRRQAPEGAGEVQDQPRGGGLRKTVGYLLTCPYCLGPWLATGLGTSMVHWPRQTGFILRVLAATTLSDFLHLSYSRSNERRKRVLAERHLSEARASEVERVRRVR